MYVVVVAVAAAVVVVAAAVCLDFLLDCRESSDDVACRWVVVVLDLANSSFPKAILVLVCRAMVERAMFRERT